MKREIGLFLVAVGIAAMSTSCGFSKKSEQGSGDSQSGQPTPGSLSSLQIGPEDWIVEDGEHGKAHAVVKTVKPEKMAVVRKHFRVPRLHAVTVPESNGFELYDVRGYTELESAVYIHPKIYINTGNGQGQVLGYRTGKKDPAGRDLIEISVPVALVNGLVPNIPTIGGIQNGPGAAVTLPSKYQIPDLNALKSRLANREIATLPVCPKLFRMTFEGREYWARSPFDNLSICPVNQFFRIAFQAPAEEMRGLLETAAVRDEAVSLITSLAVVFDVPRQVVEVSFRPEDFKNALPPALANIPVSGKDRQGNNGYMVQDLEEAVAEALFQMAKEAGFEPHYSSSLVATINPLIANYFGAPYACAAGGTCRSLLRHHFQRIPVRYGWMATEELAASLETESITALGAVANSSEFMAKPAREQLEMVRRPQYFRGRALTDVIRECAELSAAGFAFIPENTEAGREYFKSYCLTLVANGVRDDGDANQVDGYYPLGSNTVVYPGAWLKIDIDDISEFTTAKTRTLPDGRVIIESEVVDILASDPNAKRTQCLDGNAVACTEYKTKSIPVRSTSGDQMYSNEPCRKGEAGCDCVRPTNSDGSPGEEVCTRKQYLFQDVMDFSCNADDQFEFCPYWRNQEEVVDYEVEWDCQNVKVEDRSTFLCFGGCHERYEIQCKEKSRKPVKAIRQKLNCIEDDPSGSAKRERMCKAPKYKCKKWATACTKYSVNEVFNVVHEDVAAKWRPFAIQKGEYPKRFEEDIYLKFVSPGRVVSNCRLNRFPREFRGNSIYIKMPSEKNEGLQACDQPLWDEHNTQALYLPKVYAKNAISYPERRLCGRTEFSFTTKEVPMNDGDGLVPPQFSYKTESRIGPIREACRADSPFQIGPDLWFTEYPAIRFAGRVSVLGRVLESIVTEAKP